MILTITIEYDDATSDITYRIKATKGEPQMSTADVQGAAVTALGNVLAALVQTAPAQMN